MGTVQLLGTMCTMYIIYVFLQISDLSCGSISYLHISCSYFFVLVSQSSALDLKHSFVRVIRMCTVTKLENCDSMVVLNPIK